jgi:hypothetical protein
VLLAALAARDAALDRGALASRSLRRATPPTVPVTSAARLDSSDASVPVIVALDAPVAGAPRAAATVAVPDVRGMALRAAVAALHNAGLRVQLARGAAGATIPVAGAQVRRGAVVRLHYDE